MLVALDTGWPLQGGSAAERDQALGWAQEVDCLLVNEVEAAWLTGEADPTAGDVARLQRPGGIAVVKRGPRGAEALAPLGHASCLAPAVTVVDSIGAGDVFNAAFLAALSDEKSLDEAVAHGVYTASVAVSTLPRRYTPGVN